MNFLVNFEKEICQKIQEFPRKNPKNSPQKLTQSSKIRNSHNFSEKIIGQKGPTNSKNFPKI